MPRGSWTGLSINHVHVGTPCQCMPLHTSFSTYILITRAEYNRNCFPLLHPPAFTLVSAVAKEAGLLDRCVGTYVLYSYSYTYSNI